MAKGKYEKWLTPEGTESWIFGEFEKALGDKAGFKPASTINPTIVLDGKKKNARATI